MVVSVEEFEVKFDALFSAQDGDDAFAMARSRIWLLLLGSRGGALGGLDRLRRERRSHDLEEFLRRSLGEVERDLVGREHFLFLGFDGLLGRRRKVEEF